jgi:hypothetical protein
MSSAYPVTTDKLTDQVRALADELGGWPSQRRVMRTCRVGAPKADAALRELRAAGFTPTSTASTSTDGAGEPAGDAGAARVLSVVPAPEAPAPDEQAHDEQVQDQPVRDEPVPNEPPREAGADHHDQTITQVTTSADTPAPDPTTAAPTEPAPVTSVSARVPRWPLWLIAAGAFVAIWGGWVGLGEMVGFGPIRLLPGIADGFVINSAITLPLGMEAYAAYALRAWLAGPDADLTERARSFARWSALGALALGAGGQIAYHLMAAAEITTAPWLITAFVSCLPVIVLGCGAALAHLTHQSARTHPAPATEESA